MNIESGTVKTNTSTSVGEMESIMMSAPMTVTALANTCTISFVSAVLMVSMSYEIRLKMSPVWCVSKYPTGSSLSFWNTSCRIVFTTRRLMTIIRRVNAYESAADIAAQCADADAVLLDLAPMTAEAVAGLRKCKVISRYGVGFENVDLDAATTAGIQVTNVPDYCMEDVSDHAMALILSCLRHIPLRDREVREGKWNIQADSFRLKGKTLGVIGAGRIARALIRKVSGFGFAEVVAYDPYISAEQLAEIGVRKVEKEELFRISDIISLHLHANAETNGMICKETLALMKPTAILINVSRGPLVKDEDLLDALRGHRILAAGLDTHNHEPLGAQSPFCQLDNVVLTDHTAYSTAEGVTELKTKAAQNVVDVLEGRTPRYPVNHL